MFVMFFGSMFGLLLLLQIKHFLADFVLQTDVMIKDKGEYGAPAGLAHSFIHGALTAGVFAVAAPFGVYTAISIGIYDMLIHYHIDWAKMQFKAEPNSPKFWTLFGLDQLLHQLTYLAIIYWAFIIKS